MGEDGKGCNGEVCTDEKEWNGRSGRMMLRKVRWSKMREMAWYVKKRTDARNFSESEVGIERRGEFKGLCAFEDLKREETRTVRAETDAKS